MSEVQFTPSPWLVRRNVGYSVQVIAAADAKIDCEQVVCAIFDCTDYDDPQGEDAEILDARAASNAHLIAAAPDMYAALVDFIEYERLMDEDRHTAGMLKYAGMREKVIKALAKARGEA